MVKKKPKIDITLQNAEDYFIGTIGDKTFGLSLHYYDEIMEESFDSGDGTGASPLTKKEEEAILKFMKNRKR